MLIMKCQSQSYQSIKITTKNMINKNILLHLYVFSDELVHANTPLDDDKNEDGIMNRERHIITEFGFFPSIPSHLY